MCTVIVGGAERVSIFNAQIDQLTVAANSLVVTNRLRLREYGVYLSSLTEFANVYIYISPTQVINVTFRQLPLPQTGTMLSKVKLLLYIYTQLLALLTFHQATTISEMFQSVDAMALNNTWTTYPSRSQHQCAYMCAIGELCASVSYNKDTQECQLSVVPLHMLDWFAQPNSSFNIFFKKGIVNSKIIN